MRTAAPWVDLVALAAAADCSLPSAFAALRELYDDIDARNAKNTAELQLPCHRGCSMCCHQSVFLSGLEFFYAWDYAQTHLPQAVRDDIVSEAVRLYLHHKKDIDALNAPPAPGQTDHFSVAQRIRFACPMLDGAGACRVYPAREMLARLFGCSFNDEGGVYGCALVGAHFATHLAGQAVTMLRARPTARRLADLPLTQKRQIYPYWLTLLYAPQHMA